MPNRNWDLIRRMYNDSEVTGIDGVTRSGVIEDMKEACAHIAVLKAENAELKADLQQSRLAFSGALMEMPIKCEHCDDTGVVEVQYESGTDAPPHLRDEPCPSCERGELTALRRVRDCAEESLKVIERFAGKISMSDGFWDACGELHAALEKLEAPDVE